MQKRVVAGIGGKLARTAAVNIDGRPVGDGGKPSTVEAAVSKLLGSKKRK